MGGRGLYESFNDEVEWQPTIRRIGNKIHIHVSIYDTFLVIEIEATLSTSKIQEQDQVVSSLKLAEIEKKSFLYR